MPSNQVNVKNIYKIGLYEQDDQLTTFTYWQQEFLKYISFYLQFT
jgi:hypothetical protein